MEGSVSIGIDGAPSPKVRCRRLDTSLVASIADTYATAVASSRTESGNVRRLSQLPPHKTFELIVSVVATHTLTVSNNSIVLTGVTVRSLI